MSSLEWDTSTTEDSITRRVIGEYATVLCYIYLNHQWLECSGRQLRDDEEAKLQGLGRSHLGSGARIQVEHLRHRQFVALLKFAQVNRLALGVVHWWLNKILCVFLASATRRPSWRMEIQRNRSHLGNRRPQLNVELGVNCYKAYFFFFPKNSEQF